MAFPTYEDATNTDFTSSTTAHAVNMPATVNADDLLVCIISFNHSTGGVANPSGWTELYDGEHTSGFVNGSIHVKKAAGDEDGTTVDFVTTNAQEAAARVLRFSGWSGTIGDIEVSTWPKVTRTTDPTLQV